jgi:glutamyl-Q tRNA(Asp) synthetase
MSIVTRFAPSPTGLLHLGHAYSAFLSWRRARAENGIFHLRLEDIDSTRCRPAFCSGIIEDLAWLGLDWNGAVRVQSAHLAEYQAALDRLAAEALLYPCFCTRAEIAAAMGAPHASPGLYPGICRGLPAAERRARIDAGAAYALRLDTGRALHLARARGNPPRFLVEGEGWVDAAPDRLGDAVLARKDIAASYHLCVTHDDAVQGVSHVIRGEDLREATHLHALLQALLGWPTPVYAFHPLLTDATGRRLAKRDGAESLRALRDAGAAPAALRARLSRLANDLKP